MLLTMLAGCVGRETRYAILRLLRPAESALRRLLVIYVREKGVNAAAQPARQHPDFSTFSQQGETRATAFRLIDPRKRFDWAETAERPRHEPRLWAFGMDRAEPAPAASAEAPVPNLAALGRRVAALDHALKTLPAQARRLARVMARRAVAPPGPGCVGPIRPGLPPGWRRKRAEPVDDILRDCHGLAVDEVIRPP